MKLNYPVDINDCERGVGEKGRKRYGYRMWWYSKETVNSLTFSVHLMEFGY